MINIGANTTCSLVNLGITGGGYIETDDGGGGILNNGSLTISNCVIFRNIAYYGGGICNSPGASLAVYGCTIANNNGSNGGGLFCKMGSVGWIENSTFLTNSAQAGGGIFVEKGARLKTSRGQFVGNSAEDEGGAISSAGNAEIFESTLSDNDSTTGGAISGGGSVALYESILTRNRAESGGALSASGTLVVENTTFSENNGSDVGGAISSTGVVKIRGCTFSANTAGTLGGGAILNLGVMEISNSTFVGNLGHYGGAIQNTSTLTLDHATIVGNYATIHFMNGGWGMGGGIYSSGASASCSVKNSIVADNFTRESDGAGGDVEVASNIVGPSTVDHIISAAPKLGPIDFNGGPTQTMPPLFGSPAIGAAEALGLSTDQRGLLRKNLPDIGAAEFGGFPVPKPSVRSIQTSGAGGLQLTFSSIPGALFACPCRRYRSAHCRLDDGGRRCRKRNGTRVVFCNR